MLKVGIIDSGINSTALGLAAGRVAGVRLFLDADGNLKEDQDINDLLGHGTACASAILSYDTEVSFYIVNIFGATPHAGEQILVAAIKKCLEANVDIINISLGIQSEYPSGALYDICHEALDRNIAIVAAAHLDDKVCFPAYIPGVISVGNLDMTFPGLLAQFEGSPVTIYTKGEIFFNNEHFFGTSFGCPRITGEMLLLKKQLPRHSITELKAALIAKAVKVKLSYPFDFPGSICMPDPQLIDNLKVKYFHPVAKYSFAENVLILPLNDPDMRIVADVHYNNCGPIHFIYASHAYYHYHVPSLIADVGLYERFDTVALGRLRSLISLYNFLPICQQLKELLVRGKHFIVYDNYDYTLLVRLKQECESNSTILLSGPEKDCYKDFQQSRYFPALQTPVLAVIGTTSRETVSFQCHLQKSFLDLGYNVSYVSPVLQGELLGAECCCPAPAIAEVTTKEHGPFFQHILSAIQYYFQPDFILTGLPAALIAGEVSRNAAYLTGMLPDALIIVVPEDAVAAIVINNYYAAIGLTGSRRCCFILTGDCHGDHMQEMKQLLSGLGEIICLADPDYAMALEQVVKTFFSLPSTADIL